jgi:hypothetical protein
MIPKKTARSSFNEGKSKFEKTKKDIENIDIKISVSKISIIKIHLFKILKRKAKTIEIFR